MLDKKGFRYNVGIILANQDNRLFWGQRFYRDGWQFPQGGIQKYESLETAMYRELHEETGLLKQDVKIISQTDRWYYYHLPRHMIRDDTYLGQKQKWFLLRLISDESRINLAAQSKPEFIDWRWVNYWFPLHEIVSFKRPVYRKALTFMAKALWDDSIHDLVIKQLV